MDWETIITDIVHKFHQKYGHCEGAIWVWALYSPLHKLFIKDLQSFYQKSSEAWAEQLYEWCQEDGIL